MVCRIPPACQARTVSGDSPRRKTKSAASAAADFVTRKRGEENEKDNLESFVFIIKGKYEEKKGINIKMV